MCKSLTDAVAPGSGLQAGDTITVNDGSYVEPGTVNVTTPNVLIQAANFFKVTLTQNSSTPNLPAIRLVQGDEIHGLVVNSPQDGGPAVQVVGANTTVSGCILSKTGISTRDTPTYEVTQDVGHGVNNINHTSILSAPTAAATQVSPTVSVAQGAPGLNQGSSSTSLDSVIVFSGQQQGPAVFFGANDTTADGQTVPNRIRDSVLAAVNPTSSALRVTSGSFDFTSKATEIDSSILEAGSGQGAAIDVETLSTGTGQDSSGDIAITAVHATIAGGQLPFKVTAGSSGGTAPKGNIFVTFDRSIVHAIGQGTVTTRAAGPGFPLFGGAPNTAHVTIKGSDTTQQASANVTVTATSNTPDGELFVDAPHANYHLISTAPVIDKGGPVGVGESTLDVDGDPRVVGAGSDLGADEFVNHPPVASATVNPTTAKQGQVVTYDASASHDPDGTAIGGYIWNFGDGTPLVSTKSPVTTHTFALLGNYFGSVTAVDPQGLASVAFQLPLVRITDGLPPTVKITSPKAGRAFTLFTITTSKKTGKKVKKLKVIKLTGTAIDESGVASADLSLRRLALKGKKVTKSCITTDGKHSFKTTSCKTPQFFRVHFKDGAFSYTLKQGLRLKPGSYQLSARATDKAGNVSTPVVVKFTLK